MAEFAARVLGPVAGVHITLGLRAGAATKHAAVMGADVRPCPAGDIFIDRKNRVLSTPATLVESRPAQMPPTWLVPSRSPTMIVLLNPSVITFRLYCDPPSLTCSLTR